MGEPNSRRSSSGEDRLSNLPEELLRHILSFMELEDARRTCPLSRRWRSLWTTIPDFSFMCADPETEDPLDALRFPSFERFVNLILDSRKSQGIRKFKLVYVNPWSTVFRRRHYNSWIRGAVECGAQEIEVCVVKHTSLRQSLGVFSSEKLTTLRIGGNVNFTPCPTLWLPSLKFLSLNTYVRNNELVSCLLSRCPVLEEFDIKGSYEVLEIFAPKLKKFSSKIRWNSFNVPARFEIDAPSLEYFYLNNFLPAEYVIKNLDNIVEAQLFNVVYQWNLGCLFDLLRGISNVKYLYFSVFVRDGATMKISNHHHHHHNHHCLPEFPNLVCLRFGKLSDLDLLPSFLQKSPKLEVLVIERHYLVDVFWAEPQEVPGCLSSCLTHFTYKGFLGMKEEFDIVEYIVRNSSLLKTVTIHPALPLKKKLQKEKDRIYEELTILSEVSKSCEFVLEQKPFHTDDEQYDSNMAYALKIVEMSYVPKNTTKHRAV